MEMEHMSASYIVYEKLSGYKYRLKEDYYIYIPELLNYSITTEYIRIRPNGMMCIDKEYAWNGASGPAPDAKWNMRGSLLHDACYQLIRLGKLPESFKGIADAILEREMIKDGAWRWVARLFEWATNTFADYAIKPRKGEGEILFAPKKPEGLI